MKMIVLCGKPGSGKSTFSKEKFPEYVRINQDELGNRDACLKLCNESLAAGKDVIIDRVNHTPKQRSMWVQIGRMYGATIQAIYLDADSDFCLKRISARKDHPTINPEKMSVDKMRSIIRGFANEFVVPELSEGFDSILFIRVKC